MAGDINLTKDETFDGYVTEKINVIKNDLLGDYNENGKYIINEKVILELLKLEKNKRSTFNNSIFCTSYMPGYGEITFELELKKQGNNGIAVIYVLEKVDKINGYIQNTIKTQIAIYKDVLTPDFIDRSFEGFNIKKNDDQEQKELNPDDFKSSLNTYIGARKHFMDLLDNATADDYNDMYQQYFNQRIAILKEDGSEYAKLVLKNYSAEYEKIKDYFLKNEGAVDYKALNELLDKCFEDVNGLDPKNREKEEELKKKMIPYLHALMMQAQAINQKGKEKVVKKAKANEKQKLEQIAKDKEKTEKSKTAPKKEEKAKVSNANEHPINDNSERLKDYLDSQKIEKQTTVEKSENVADYNNNPQTDENEATESNQSTDNTINEFVERGSSITGKESSETELTAEAKPMDDNTSNLDVPQFEDNGNNFDSYL